MQHRLPLGENRGPVSKWQKHDRFARFGLWRAEVINTEDPQFRGRIQVRILHLHPPGLQPAASSDTSVAKSDILVQANTTGATPFEGVPPAACPWAEPANPFGGKKGFNSGFIMTPYVGSTVWVAFEMGYSGKPVWFGSWLGKDEIPEEIATAEDMKDIRLIRTEFGHLLLFDDAAGAERTFLGVCPNTGDRVRFLEFDEANKQVRLFNDPDGAGTGSGTRIYMTESEIVLSKGDPSNATVLTMNTDKIEIKCETSKVTINKSGTIAIESNDKITQTSVGAHEIEAPSLLVTLSGNVTVNAGSAQVNTTGDAVINATGNANVIGAAVNLGEAAPAQAVCLDSLIAVIATAYGLFNTHVHTYTPNGSGVPASTTSPEATPGGAPIVQVPPTTIANTSSTVKAKL